MNKKLFLIASFIVSLFISQNVYSTQYVVNTAGNTFVPATLSINIGDTVIWNNTGGFHYGFPFFISKNKEKIENYSKIKFNKYNYLKYENYLELKDPNLFKDFQLSYKELSLSKSQPQTLDDLRDDLFLFDLDWIKNTNKDILRKEINSFKEFIE